MEFAAGDRSYGTSFRGGLEYTHRRGEISLTYDEGPATRSELVFSRQPIIDTGGFGSVIEVDGLADRFVLKRGSLVVTAGTAKTETALRIFSEDRENVTSTTGVSLETESLLSAELTWAWRFGRKTTLTLGAGFAEREALRSIDNVIPVFYDDEIRSALAGIAYEFGTRFSLTGEYRWREGGGDPQNFLQAEENQIRLMLNFSL